MSAGARLAWGSVALGLGIGVWLALSAASINGAASFPLDDSWIHLTYARQLAHEGTFAYSPGEPVTQGSTSPLFTLLLAAGFLLTENEKLLGVALSLASHAAFLAALAWWALARLRSVWWTAAVIALVALDPNVAMLSVSGMETPLFLACVALALGARARGRLVLEGGAAGLAVWVRPEGLILAAVLAVDHAIDRASRDRRATRISPPALAAFALPVAAWLIFNVALGGALLPNTFAAKTAYYGVITPGAFLRGDVSRVLTSAGWIVASILAAIQASREGWRIVRRRRGIVRAEAGWVVALIAAFTVFLPFSHRFDRYLVPILPAIAILGFAVAKDALDLVRTRLGRTVAVAIALAVILLPLALRREAIVDLAETYATFCRYQLDRHERIGRWIEANTPKDAVIATHDVGAIAFYGRRRIVDTVGVVLPEAVAYLGDPGYIGYLEGLFARKGVTHVASLRNWLRVSNVEPLIVAGPDPPSLEVYPWIPGRTHLVPRAAARREETAVTEAMSGSLDAAVAAIDEAVRIDPRFGAGWLLRGQLAEMMRRFPEAEAAYRRAVDLAPDSAEARLRLAVVVAAQGRRAEAQAVVRGLLAMRPGHEEARRLDAALLGGAGAGPRP